MYFPIGWHKVLNLDAQEASILSVQANHERELFFVLTTKSLHIWYPKPAVEILCHRRSTESIENIGLNRLATWKTDSSVIVVATDRDQLLFYQVRKRSTNFPLQASSSSDSIYRLHQHSSTIKTFVEQKSSPGTLKYKTDFDSVPALTIFSFGKLDLSTVGVSCLMPAEEELIVGAQNGEIYGVHWNGNVDDKFPWSLSKSLNDQDHLVDIKFSSVLLGFALVFYTGRVAFMPSKDDLEVSGNSNDEVDSDTYGSSSVNFLSSVNNAVCTEINHKYRLVAVGLRDSTVAVCCLGESNSTLMIDHKLEVQPHKVSYDVSKLGSLKCMSYSPDSFALVTSWECGEFAIWSVFGSMLFCSIQWRCESSSNMLTQSMKIFSLAWGQEGYNIWLCTNSPAKSHQDKEGHDSIAYNIQGSEDSESMKNSINGISQQEEEVMILSIAHSNLTSNPHITCSSDSIILMSESRIYLGPSAPHKDKFDHWIIVDIPQQYLSANSPLRYATVDRECKNLAIAGRKGLAIYSIESSKWKHLKKKNMEDSFSVCGDLIWWRDYIVLSCYNMRTDMFELRAYQSRDVLDDNHSIVLNTRMEIIRMSIFENRILALYSDGTLGMFMLNSRIRPRFKSKNSPLERSNSNVSAKVPQVDLDSSVSQSPKSSRSDSLVSFNYPASVVNDYQNVVLQISPIENLVISNLQSNAYCISSIALTRLHFKNSRCDDSILMNACGKLFLLEREINSELPETDFSGIDFKEMSIDSDKSKTSDVKVKPAQRLSNSIHLASASLRSTIEPEALSNVTFRAVSVIATNVEQFWISPEISNASEMSYFRKSLWLSCGGSSNYLQVWLPLLNDKNDPPTDLYVPDRIMLPIRCDIYPLAIRSSAPDVAGPDDAIVLGAESDIMFRDNDSFSCLPYSTIKRECRVYLHRILRELLLNQHLGYYARKIAESCQSLPYFVHCFELLLHEVLEEEATSPVPLPDPMLPQVVRFIKEFPVYIETVVHCARKSELSMWSHLFDERAVGNPRRLFQECLEKNKLDTAASCLIILQGLDRNIVSQRMVKELIRAARSDPDYNYLIEDLENFLSRAELDYMSASGSGSPSNQ